MSTNILLYRVRVGTWVSWCYSSESTRNLLRSHLDHMLSAPSSSAPGPSLPPNVTGELIGTLTIRLQECSIAATFARIKFWGAQTFSDLHPSQNRPAPDEMPNSQGHHRLVTVEYPLMGSILGLYKYLEDALPLQVRFFGYPKCNHQPQTKKANLGDEMPQPELVGCYGKAPMQVPWYTTSRDSGDR